MPNEITSTPEQRLELYTEPAQFAGLYFDKKAKGIVLAWRADTEAPNIWWLRMFIIGFTWPPIRLAQAFLPRHLKQ